MEGKIDLTERVNSLQARFKELGEEAKKLVEQREVLNRRLIEIRDEQLKLSGAYDFVMGMSQDANDEENKKAKEQPKLEIPSKKKENEGESEEVVDG